MDTIVKRLLTLALTWLMNPENIKKMIQWTIDYIDKRAKENPEEDFWDTLDEIIDMVVEAVSTKFAKK